MTPDQYLKESARTSSENRWRVLERVDSQETVHLLHAALGCCTESAEFVDAIKKRLMYGKPLDRVNLIEEIGDILWYQALALRALGSTFEEAMALNIDKLRKRFPDRFSEHCALNRDLDAEREVLEGEKV